MPYKVIKRATHSLQFSNDTAYPVPLSTKTIAPLAVSANPTKEKIKTYRSRRNEQSIHHQWKTCDTSPTKSTETRTVQARTPSNQSICWSGDKQSAPDTSWLNPCQPRQPTFPRRSGYPQGSGEVLERDRGAKSPVSFQPPPRGANKIYTYDEVFLMEEGKTNDQSPTQLTFSPHRQEKSKNPEKTCKKGLTSGEECGILSELQESGTARSAKGERTKKTWKKFKKPLDKRTTKWYTK